MISIVLCIQTGLIIDSLSRPEIVGSFEVEHMKAWSPEHLGEKEAWRKNGCQAIT